MRRPPDQEHSRPGEQEPQPVMIFDVALDDYLAWHQQYRPATATAYAGDLLHLAHALRPVATVCSQVREEQLQAYVEQLGTVYDYGAATIARKVYVIKSFFRTLCARGCSYTILPSDSKGQSSHAATSHCRRRRRWIDGWTRRERRRLSRSATRPCGH